MNYKKAKHNKLTVTLEYCKAIGIDAKIKGEALFIKTVFGYSQVCYSLYNLTYIYILEMIDNYCDDSNIYRNNR